MYAAIYALVIISILVFLAVVRYRRQKYRKCCRTLLLIPVTDDDKLFESRVKSCYWEEAFDTPAYSKEIILVVMHRSANVYAAQRLAQQYPSVHVVHVSSLGDYLMRNYKL
jgi:hypothetical protein